jgi:hypothetical protein
VHLTWTDFGTPGRVHVIRKHRDEAAGRRELARLPPAYPSPRLCEVDLPYVETGDQPPSAAARIAARPVLARRP